VTQAQFLHTASEWVIQLAFWCSLAFPAWYSIWAPWWRNAVGRAIVALDSAIALATLPTVIGLDFGASVVASPFFSWLTVCAFACIPVITCWRMVIVYRVQRRPRVEGRPRRTVLARISDQHHHPGEPDSDAG
jgi:hypothetical protein